MRRYPRNPILTAADLPENTGYYILNPGAVKFRDEYILLVDVFHVEGGIVFWIARSRDGYHFKFDPRPVDWPSPPAWWHENGVYGNVFSVAGGCGRRGSSHIDIGGYR